MVDFSDLIPGQSTEQPQPAPQPDTGGLPIDVFDRGMSIVSGLQARGMSRSDAIAYAANSVQESGANPYSDRSSTGAAGAFQWVGARLKYYQALHGHDPEDGDLNEQLDHVVWENQNNEKASWKQIQEAPDTPEARTEAVSDKWERAGEDEKNNSRRLSIARIFDMSASAAEAPSDSQPLQNRHSASKGMFDDLIPAAPSGGTPQHGKGMFDDLIPTPGAKPASATTAPVDIHDEVTPPAPAQPMTSVNNALPFATEGGGLAPDAMTDTKPNGQTDDSAGEQAYRAAHEAWQNRGETILTPKAQDILDDIQRKGGFKGWLAQGASTVAEDGAYLAGALGAAQAGGQAFIYAASKPYLGEQGARDLTAYLGGEYVPTANGIPHMPRLTEAESAAMREAKGYTTGVTFGDQAPGTPGDLGRQEREGREDLMAEVNRRWPANPEEPQKQIAGPGGEAPPAPSPEAAAAPPSPPPRRRPRTPEAAATAEAEQAAVTPSTPEPASDIQAQVNAMRDPANPKDSVFVAAGNEGALPKRLPKGTLVAKDPSGTFLTTNPDKLAEFKNGPVTDEKVAGLLGYPQVKADAVASGEPVVVQGTDQAGNVVVEAAASPDKVQETKAAIQVQTPEGGTVEIKSPTEAQQERGAKVAEEKGQPVPVTSSQVQKRDGVGYNKAVEIAKTENEANGLVWDAGTSKWTTPPEPAPPPKADGEWSEIGTNLDGQPLYQDTRGVRSYVNDGVRVTENVGMMPTKTGMMLNIAEPANKAPEFQVAAWHNDVGEGRQPEYTGPETASTMPGAGTPPPPPPPPNEDGWGAGNKTFTEDKANAARERLRAKLGRLNSGFDPEFLLDGLTLAGYHIEAGARKFADYAKRMIEDLGESARPYLKQFYNAVRDHPGFDTKGMDDYAAVDAELQKGAIEPTVPKEAENGDQRPVRGRDEGPGPEGVHGTPPVGETGPAPAESEPRGPQDAGGPAGERTEGLGGNGQEPERTEDGGGNSQGDPDRLPGPDSERPTGTPGRPAEPDDWVAGKNFSIEPGGLAEDRGPTAKARDNVTAIELAKRLIAADRPASRAEQEILSKYVGWGGLKNVFPNPTTGKYGQGLEKVGARLKEVLSKEEYDAAEASIQNAHYTAEHVIRSMWSAVERMGFTGGNVFEPGMGVGHFLGMMPPDVAARSTYQGIEMDHMTAGIAKLLYPESGVRQADFIKTPMPDNHFDLVIGNPPFNDVVIHEDPKYSARNFMLHDYFFAKSMDTLRPGGLMGFVTSAGTMNKMDPGAREYLASRAEFVGGVRLPSSAFRQNAGTDVTTDVLFFKKRQDSLPIEAIPDHQAWTSVVKRTLPDSDGKLTEGNVSRYFSDHPEMVLGQEGYFDKLYKGRYAVHQTPGSDLGADLSTALARLPENIMEAAQTPEDRAALDFASGQRKEGSFYIDPKRGLMQYSGGAGSPVARRGQGAGGFTVPELDRIRHLVPVRDALRDVFRYDLLDDAENAALAREALNRHYDTFVTKFGPINKAEFSYRRPTAVQAERLRLEAREDARSVDQPWEDGDFDPSSMIAKGATVTDISKARQRAMELAEKAGRSFDHGTFDPADLPDIRIEKRPNISPFMSDPESYRLRSIEDYNDETHVAAKKRIFRESVLTRETEPVISSANDGVLWSLNKFGRMDLDQISAKMGKPREDLIRELGDAVFRVPGTNDTYHAASEYLSGDVVAKLDEARKALETDSDMERNVRALEKAIPLPLGPDDISMNLGMPWIPRAIVEQYAAEHLKIGRAGIFHIPLLGQWRVSEGTRGDRSGLLTYGTTRRDAHELLSDAMNRTPPRIYDHHADGSRTFNETATQEAHDKYNVIKEEFASWLESDSDRLTGLAKLYNDSLNRTVLRTYDGGYLTTPGISSEWRWRPHQTRVVARVIQSGTTYMAHAVGAGKTSAMIGSGMEMRRLGVVKKPMYVVPNHMLGQFTKEFYEQYPTARISVADEDRFHTDKRRQFMSDVAQDDLDAVIITHSSFKKIPISDDFNAKIIQEELDKLREAMSGLNAQTDRITIRQIRNAMDKLRQKLSKATGEKQDITNTFEELGVDFLFVDEAHLFRKLTFASQQKLKGIDPSGSNMAFDLYAKIRYLDQQNPGRSVVLASGTPVTNTMGELYTISRYLQRPAMDLRGVGPFDSWSQMFGDTKTDLEAQPDGSFKPVTRFAKFVNMPELYKMVGEVMDIVTPEQLSKYVTRPKLAGGERKLHIAEFTEQLQDYQAQLAARMQAIADRHGPPQPGDDIILSVINDGRHAAIDPRFVMEGASDPRSKLNLMIDNVAKIWADTKRTQFYHPRNEYTEPAHVGPATQMIFMNMGVNGRGPMGFSGYAWIKNQLRARGIPASEIAVIGDYKGTVARQALFNDMNEGKVRILLGSVAKMGTGVNAQRLLVALHNQDPLWYPADDEQRVGRMLRQGNMNPLVQVHDYTTMDTYDRTMWSMMGRKGRFIEQFFRGDPELRDMEDLGEASTYEQAAAMATSDPRVFRLTELRQALQTAERRASAFGRRKQDLAYRLQQQESWVKYYTQSIANYEADLAQRVSTKGDDFAMQIGDQTYTTRKDAAKALADQWPAVSELKPNKDMVVGSLGGFQIVAGKGPKETSPIDYAIRLNGGREIDLYAGGVQDPDAAASLIAGAEPRLRGIEDSKTSHESSLTESQAEIARIKSAIEEPFTGAADITKMAVELRELERSMAPKDPNAPPVAVETPASASAWQAPIRAVLEFDKGDGTPFLSRTGAAGEERVRSRRDIVRRGASAMMDRLRMQQNLDERKGRHAVISDHEARQVDKFLEFVGADMFDDVGLSIMRGPAGVNGMFNAGDRAITLFRQSIERGDVPHTMVHELWHSQEGVLPSEDRAALVGEFRRRRDKWLKKNEWARSFLDGDELRDRLVGQEARAWFERFGQDANADRQVEISGMGQGTPVVKIRWGNDNYRYKNASEYFAETMSDRYFDDQEIMNARVRSIWGHVRDLWRRFVAGLARAFGYDSTGRIYEGFRNRDYVPGQGGTGGMLSDHGVAEARAPRPSAAQRRARAAMRARPFDVVEDKKGLTRASAEVKSMFSPTSLLGAKPMEQLARLHGAEKAQSLAQAYVKLEKARDTLSKLSKDEQVDFTDRMEWGTQQPTNELEAVATGLRDTLDEWRDKIQSLGRGYLENAIDNYMGHIWANYAEWKAGLPPPTAAQIAADQRMSAMARRPLRGSGNFLKPRTFETQLDGINAGLIPTTYNPVDLQLIKIREMQKFYHGTVLADRMKNTGLATWVPAGKERAAESNGMVKLDDRVFQPRASGPAIRIERGNWYAPEPIARLFNNYMSPGLAGRSMIYDTIRMSGNALNTLQLGLSGFHATFVTLDTMISQAALGLRQVMDGDIGKGMLSIGLAPTPYSVVKALRDGSNLRNAWLDPQNVPNTPTGQKWLKLADDLNRGGGRVSMDQFFRNSASGTFFEHLTDLKHPQSALYQVAQMFRDEPSVWRKGVMVPLRIVGRTLDTIIHPLMGHMVPRAKLGVFSALAQQWDETHPMGTRPPGSNQPPNGATEEERAAAMIKIWDSVENRLGQLTYDNVFWDRRLKDTAFVTTRSVGWNLGTLREIGGAGVDTGQMVADAVRGRGPEFTYRQAYTIMLPIITGLIGSVICYLATGHGPERPLDAFYPPVGGVDASGNPQRVSIPGYMKDVVAMSHDPWGTLGNKTHPLLSTAIDLKNNRDYFGGIIYNKNTDNIAGAYLDYLLNQEVPFSVRSMLKMRADGDTPQSQAMSFWGFQPAPKSITSPEKGEAYNRRQDNMAMRRRNRETGRLHIFTPGP